MRTTGKEIIEDQDNAARFMKGSRTQEFRTKGKVNFTSENLFNGSYAHSEHLLQAQCPHFAALELDADQCGVNRAPKLMSWDRNGDTSPRVLF